MEILIGSYTNKEKIGLYQFEFDELTGETNLVATYDEVTNPSYLIVEPTRNSVYVVSETHDLQGGGVAQYTMDQHNKLKFSNLQLTGGKDPCHLTIHQDNLLVANYSSGNLSVHDFEAQDVVSASIQILQHTGKGTHQERQENPHIHFVIPAPKAGLVAVVDLGLDSITFYVKVKNQYGAYSTLQCKSGSGPRHLVFHEKLSLFYVVNELSSTVSVYHYREDFKEFNLLQTVSTIPSSFSENNQCAAIVMSKDCLNLYITNRGHDSIAVYEIENESGLLKLMALTPTEGHWPRDCALSLNQDYLFVANELSDCISIFRRENVGGGLVYQSDFPVSEPTCIAFIGK